MHLSSGDGRADDFRRVLQNTNAGWSKKVSTRRIKNNSNFMALKRATEIRFFRQIKV